MTVRLGTQPESTGAMVPRAKNSIEFSNRGSGRILGVNQKNSTSHEPYEDVSCSAFSNRVMTIVQAGREGRKITGEVPMDGLVGDPVCMTSTGT